MPTSSLHLYSCWRPPCSFRGLHGHDIILALGCSKEEALASTAQWQTASDADYPFEQDDVHVLNAQFASHPSDNDVLWVGVWEIIEALSMWSEALGTGLRPSAINDVVAFLDNSDGPSTPASPSEMWLVVLETAPPCSTLLEDIDGSTPPHCPTQEAPGQAVAWGLRCMFAVRAESSIIAGVKALSQVPSMQKMLVRPWPIAEMRKVAPPSWHLPSFN